MERNLDDILKDFATDLLNIIIFQLEQPYISASGKRFKGLDKRSTMRNSITAVIDSTPSIKIDAPDYFIYFDKGRKPFTKKIPIRAILKWIRTKRIKARDSRGRFTSITTNQLAYMIQNSIYNIGIRPRNVIKKTLQQIDKLYKNNVEKGVKELIDNLFINFNDNVIKTNNALFNVKPQRIKPK